MSYRIISSSNVVDNMHKNNDIQHNTDLAPQIRTYQRRVIKLLKESQPIILGHKSR
jgi:hypothetical protein